MTDRALHIYVDLEGAPHLVGRLWARSQKGKESATFEYDPTWLTSVFRFALEPALTLGTGPHHTAAGRSIFGAIGDSAPDRWGRVLIQRDERRKAREEKRVPRTLLEADYLLGVGDAARQGALRFAEQEGGPFLAAGTQIPPLIQLPALLGAAMRLSEDDGGSDDDLRLLLAPGSSLGGARPKASIVDRDGQLAIAKFPQHGDQTRVTLWEAVALTLAKQAGIPTPAWRAERVADRDVLLLRRFDRQGMVRIPFLSAISLLNAADNEPHSYMEIADALRQYGAKADEDCAQLWRRIVFNILISNTDDHLRNHGFLYESNGWRLSPAYDLNPMPVDIKPRILTTAIDEADSTASLDLAYEVAAHFGVKADKAKSIAREVGHAVASWRGAATAAGLTTKEIERMASAFEHDDLARAVATS
ncbi:MAG: type II toxin-antitoxin system HipA family toxin [Bradyrhizobium sp.]|nr:type II toxin-antitoxin system HipA family toxin [Bradyrhizobium sp.]